MLLFHHQDIGHMFWLYMLMGLFLLLNYFTNLIYAINYKIKKYTLHIYFKYMYKFKNFI